MEKTSDVFVLMAKIFLFPFYFVILFYRNVKVLWSDDAIAKYINKSRKTLKEDEKLTDRHVADYLKKKGVYCIEREDIRATMRAMKACKVQNKKVNGVFSGIIDSLTFLMTRKDFYVTLNLLEFHERENKKRRTYCPA